MICFNRVWNGISSARFALIGLAIRLIGPPLPPKIWVVVDQLLATEQENAFTAPLEIEPGKGHIAEALLQLTLGKRLAQRKMSQDLRTWLKASYSDAPDASDIPMEGLDMIDMHIDPTDFIAFNRYQHNLRIFINFALNTDTDANPWVVVNTTDRLAARKQVSLTEIMMLSLHS